MTTCTNQTVSRIPSVTLPARLGQQPSVLARIAGGIASLSDSLLAWQARASQRRRLSELPDYLLSDIGVTRADAEREVSKPFWRS